MGRWSEDNAVSVFHCVLFSMLLLIADMSGEEFAWLVSNGERVWVSLFNVM
jgi:hypothetical protein